MERLSAIVEMNWSEGTEQSADAWTPRFELICQLLRHVKGTGRVEEEEVDGAGIEPTMEWRLRRVEWLDLEVSVAGMPSENVPVNARLHGDDLTVAGRPIQFGADAAKELTIARAPIKIEEITDFSAGLDCDFSRFRPEVGGAIRLHPSSVPPRFPGSELGGSDPMPREVALVQGEKLLLGQFAESSTVCLGDALLVPMR